MDDIFYLAVPDEKIEKISQTLLLRKDNVTKNFKTVEETPNSTDKVVKIEITPVDEYMREASSNRWKTVEKKLVVVLSKDDPNMVRLNNIVADFARKIKNSQDVKVTETQKSVINTNRIRVKGKKKWGN